MSAAAAGRAFGGLRGSISGMGAGVELFIGSGVQCLFCFEICTPEGRGGIRDLMGPQAL